MKLKKLLTGLLVSTGIFMTTSLSSCSSFFNSGDEGTMIKEILTKDLEDGNIEITIKFIDEEKEPVVFVVKQGNNGEQGKEGNGIKSISQEVSEDGKKITLVISYTDDTKEPTRIDVPVINGKDGVSIKEIVPEKQANGDTKVIIKFEQEEIPDASFIIPKGEQGESGNGIKEVVVNDNEDGSREIIISYTDINKSDTVVSIPAPKEGNGISFITSDEDDEANLYILNIYYTDGSNSTVSFSKPSIPSTWLSGNYEPDDATGRNGDFYFDKINLRIYQKMNDSWTYIAQLSNAKEKHTLTFDPNGGMFTPDSLTSIEVEHGNNLYGKNLIPKVTREGYVFIGWYTSPNQLDQTSGKFTDLTPVTSNMTLYAWWEEAAK